MSTEDSNDLLDQPIEEKEETHWDLAQYYFGRAGIFMAAAIGFVMIMVLVGLESHFFMLGIGASFLLLLAFLWGLVAFYHFVRHFIHKP